MGWIERKIIPARERLNRQLIELEHQAGRLPKLSATVDSFGGCVTSFTYGGVDIIVPREQGNEKRSGIPRLGPVAGPVKGQPWERLYPQMPSHGTDRISPMGVAWVAENEVVLETTEGPRTFRGAWKTTLRVRLSYSGGHLSIYQTVENLEPGFRERAVAFHPYFVNPGDMQVLNPKALLVPPPLGEASLCDGNYQVIYRVGGFVVHLLSSPTPVTLVDWRDDDSFRCIEPWWGGEGHGVVFEPGEKKTFKLKLRVFKDSG